MAIAAAIIFGLPLLAIGFSIAVATQIVGETNHKVLGRWIFRLSILVFFWCMIWFAFAISLPGNTWITGIEPPFNIDWLELFKTISYLLAAVIVVLLGRCFMLGINPGKSFFAITLWVLSVWVVRAS